MIRSMDYGNGKVARALLSERYRRIDNMEIASAVLTLFAGREEFEVISCEVTENRLYLKIVNHRLEMAVVPGDYVKAGVVISNSEAGLGSVSVQPLLYRLVCTNNSDVLVISDIKLFTLFFGKFASKYRNNIPFFILSIYNSIAIHPADGTLTFPIHFSIATTPSS